MKNSQHAGESMADPLLYYRNITSNMVNVLTAMKEFDVNRVRSGLPAIGADNSVHPFIVAPEAKYMYVIPSGFPGVTILTRATSLVCSSSSQAPAPFMAIQKNFQ